MEGEFEQFIKDGAYEELLTRTDEILAASPHDTSALAFRGRALAALQRYDEASHTLQAAIVYSRNSKRLTAISKLDQVCRAIVNMTNAYRVHSSENNAWDKDWYSHTLSEVYRLNKEAATPTSPEELWSQKTLDPFSAYILGPAKRVDAFNRIDYGVCKSVREPLPCFPTSQGDGLGYMYLRRQTYLCPYGFPKKSRRSYREEGPEPAAEFPVVKWESKGQVRKPNLKCDVFYSNDSVDKTIAKLLRWSLDKLAAQRQDFFVPQYHNIIDPNLTALLDPSTNVYRWTATEFLIKEVRVPRKTTVMTLQGCIRRSIGRGLPWHSIQLILSYSGQTLSFGRAHLASPLPLLPLETHRELAYAVESILTAALPLVADLRKPAILLPGKLQVVVKAQSIYLNPGEEYEGVWHYDGLNENIVAVVLYYYRYSANLEGGDLEFLSRKPRDEEFWLHGDCDPDLFRKEEVQEFMEELPHARVPMGEGILVVFSNYQLVHRVLRMVNRSDKVASRDFLVLFIVDQRTPLQSTQQLPERLDKQASESIREQLFFEQLKPSGKFGIYDNLVYSTGNGSCALLGWMEKNDYEADASNSSKPRPGILSLKQLSECPPLHRGISWIFDTEQWEGEKRKLYELKNYLEKRGSREVQTFIIQWADLSNHMDPWSETIKCVSRQQLEEVIEKAENSLQLTEKVMEDPDEDEDICTLLEVQEELRDIVQKASEQLDLID